MNDAKYRVLKQILTSERRVERLSSNITNGDAFRIMLNENENGSSGFLLLLPNSEILEHKHINDWEEYTFLDGHTEKCSIGNSHQLKNETEELMVVHFAKHRVF